MKIAKVINEMYTELFSRFQPVLEQKLEKLLSLGRDLSAKETKTRDQGVYCNLQQDNSNEKETFSSAPSTYSTLPSSSTTSSQSSSSSGSTSVLHATSYSLENLKGCCDTPDPDSQNPYDKEQSQIRLSSQLKSSTQIKLLLEVNRIDHNKEDIDEQAKIHLDKVHNHLHNCLDGLPVHEPFVPTSEMLESGAIIMTGENSSECSVRIETQNSAGGSADHNSLTSPLEKLLEETAKPTATETSTSHSAVDKQLLTGPISTDTLGAPVHHIGKTSPTTERSSGSDSAHKNSSTNTKSLTVSQPAQKLNIVTEQRSSSLPEAKVHLVSILRDEKTIAETERTRATSSLAPRVAVTTDSDSGSATVLDTRKALPSTSDAPIITTTSIDAEDNNIAEEHEQCTKQPRIDPTDSVPLTTTAHPPELETQMAAHKRSLQQSEDPGNNNTAPPKKKVRILEPPHNSTETATNQSLQPDNHRSLLDAGFIDDDEIWSDPSIYEQLDRVVEEKKKQPFHNQVASQQCQPDTISHLTKNSTSSSRSCLSNYEEPHMTSRSGSMPGGSHLSQTFDTSYSIGLTQTVLSDSLPATALSQHYQPVPTLKNNYYRRPGAQNNGSSNSSQHSPYAMNNQSQKQYNQQTPVHNAHYPQHNDAQNNSTARCQQRQPQEQNHQQPRTSESRGQSYSALQQQFNSMQYSGHPLQHFPTDIPSSSTGDPTVRTLELRMQHQPQRLMFQRNNNYNEGRLQISNGQLNSGGHVFQPHQHHSELEQTRFTDQGNDHQDHCQLLEIRDSTTQEKEVYETIDDNTPGISQNDR